MLSLVIVACLLRKEWSGLAVPRKGVSMPVPSRTDDGNFSADVSDSEPLDSSITHATSFF